MIAFSAHADQTVYSTATDTTFTVPSGVTQIIVKAWGAGGGGGGNTNGAAGGGAVRVLRRHRPEDRRPHAATCGQLGADFHAAIGPGREVVRVQRGRAI